MTWGTDQADALNEDGPSRKRRKVGVSEDGWSTILYETIPASLDDEIMVDPKSRRIGNRDGQCLLEEIGELREQLKHTGEDLKREIEKQKKEIDKLHARADENGRLLFAAYANELERTAGKSDPASRYTRNAIIHGGHIKYAIESIEHLERFGKTTRVQNASKGFEITYGVSRDQIQDIIKIAPGELVDWLNRRAELKKSQKWQDLFPCETEQWIKEVDQAIQMFVEVRRGIMA